MKPILPVLLKDGYKVGHPFQYAKDTILVYSNFTPRSSRVEGVREVVPFGFQYFVQEYLIEQFNENFFKRSRKEVLALYKRRIDNYLGPGVSVDHIGALHDMGFLPLHVKAIPEGTLVPLRVPVLTIRNTVPEFFWLTNMVETLLSNVLWIASTSATTAFGYRKVFEDYARKTGGDKDFVKWQGHDFSFRGLAGIEAACLSGAGHLLSFTGTDTIPAIDFLENYYGANCEKELVGGSVPATEHSVMCMGLKDGEFETIKRLITEVYPEGIVSIVSDTWDFWKVVTDYIPRLKEEILARNGKVVIRPDSGDPVKIIVGDPNGRTAAERAGAIASLYSCFPGRTNPLGYRELDPHIGLIYGDSITPQRQVEILDGLRRNGYSSSNVVLGIGSYTYQYVTRDTYGWAMKATYGETSSGGPQAIYKDPVTDDGIKKSAVGLLKVDRFPGGQLWCAEKVNWEHEDKGLLQTIFRNGSPHNFQTLAQIRARIEAQL
jgi:nicotinamide phosphoribosyltransferase